jgi:predicted O-methyltransferase YrrM
MSQTQWSAVERYTTDLLVPPDPALDAALQATTDAGMPPANVSPKLGKLLHVLAEGTRPFDLVFIDAGKPNNTAYFE